MMWRALVLAWMCLIGHVAGDGAFAADVQQGTGAMLRGLDKVGGRVQDIDLANGETHTLGRLQIELVECRYPAENPAGEAYAFLIIRDASGPLFSGWMIASSPALNPLDHARYDVWVLRCKVE